MEKLSPSDNGKIDCYLRFFKAMLLFGFLLLPLVSEAQEYKLVWSDEFSFPGLPDTTKWGLVIGGKGWGNAELEYYRDGTHNAEVRDGNLIITARADSFENRAYTSARLTSKMKNEGWVYGKIEARIKLPYGQGIWPAFWMLGTSIDTIRWPRCGEIDIMEMIGGNGRENTVHGTIHFANSERKHDSRGGKITLDKGKFSDEFHVYSIDWSPDSIKWLVDGKQYFATEINTEEFSAFHHKFFILLNLAVGGYWPGNPDETTVFPQEMKVDYVRVYQKEN
ncbi:MAG: glycoside hydrolase family 16 protein [Bacteroidales bacterium]|nr:glycoside hydrolase family 16 protein [Bacteroidales bacterium]MCB9012832.1 glycoside hydrolase family 16 protein [Bacteroidales bacterium]